MPAYWHRVPLTLESAAPTLALCASLRCSSGMGAAYLLRLWRHAMIESSSVPGERRSQVVARIAQWSGKPEILVDGLLAAGFLADDGSSLRIVPWEDVITARFVGGGEDQPARPPPKSDAERQRLYRQRHRHDVTPDVTPVTDRHDHRHAAVTPIVTKGGERGGPISSDPKEKDLEKEGDPNAHAAAVARVVAHVRHYLPEVKEDVLRHDQITRLLATWSEREITDSVSGHGEDLFWRDKIVWKTLLGDPKAPSTWNAAVERGLGLRRAGRAPRAAPKATATAVTRSAYAQELAAQQAAYEASPEGQAELARHHAQRLEAAHA